MDKNKHLCDYGCGKEAIIKFQNGNWCCSKNWQSCPNVKNNKVPWNKGILYER